MIQQHRIKPKRKWVSSTKKGRIYKASLINLEKNSVIRNKCLRKRNTHLENKLKVYVKFKFPCNLKEHDFEIETCEGFSEEDVEFVLKTLI